MKLRTKCLEQDRNLPDLFLMSRALGMASLQAQQMKDSRPEKIDVIKHNFTHRPKH